MRSSSTRLLLHSIFTTFRESGLFATSARITGLSKAAVDFDSTGNRMCYRGVNITASRIRPGFCSCDKLPVMIGGDTSTRKSMFISIITGQQWSLSTRAVALLTLHHASKLHACPFSAKSSSIIRYLSFKPHTPSSQDDVKQQ